MQNTQFCFLFNLLTAFNLTLWHLEGIWDSRTKTTGSHVALHVCNLGTESGRELFKGSKDTASLLVCT